MGTRSPPYAPREGFQQKMSRNKAYSKWHAACALFSHLGPGKRGAEADGGVFIPHSLGLTRSDLLCHKANNDNPTTKLSTDYQRSTLLAPSAREQHLSPTTRSPPSAFPHSFPKQAAATARSGRTRRQNGRRGCATAGQARLAARPWAATDGSEPHGVPAVLSPRLGHVRLRAAGESRQQRAASARPPAALTAGSEASELPGCSRGQGASHWNCPAAVHTHTPEMPKVSLQGQMK